MPEDEVRSPERQRDERVREHPQPHDAREAQEGPEQRPGQPGEQAEGREVAEKEVLRHVEGEQPLLADPRDRRSDRDDEERDAEREERDAPPRNRLAAASESARPDAVRERDQGDRGELERIERPAGPERRVVHRTAGVRLQPDLVLGFERPKPGSG
jgi:hypothetical protein